MTDPIYPDPNKTGLAALKPLLMAYCDEPERWVWEHWDYHDKQRRWEEYRASTVIPAVEFGHWDSGDCRLTPKPRRVWIGDQSYPEPITRIDKDVTYYVADPITSEIYNLDDFIGSKVVSVVENGFAFAKYEHAQQCLDAYRKARRVE